MLGITKPSSKSSAHCDHSSLPPLSSLLILLFLLFFTVCNIVCLPFSLIFLTNLLSSLTIPVSTVRFSVSSRSSNGVFLPSLVVSLVFRHLVALILLYILYGLGRLIWSNVKLGWKNVWEDAACLIGSEYHTAHREWSEKLERATSYGDWVHAAKQLDELEGKIGLETDRCKSSLQLSSYFTQSIHFNASYLFTSIPQC